MGHRGDGVDICAVFENAVGPLDANDVVLEQVEDVAVCRIVEKPRQCNLPSGAGDNVLIPFFGVVGSARSVN
jgi:hypothetical protein